MNFEHNEDRRMLADALNRYLGEQYPAEYRNKVAYDQAGYSAETYAKLAEIGAIGALFKEADGGFGEHDVGGDAPAKLQIVIEQQHGRQRGGEVVDLCRTRHRLLGVGAEFAEQLARLRLAAERKERQGREEGAR